MRQMRIMKLLFRSEKGPTTTVIAALLLALLVMAADWASIELTKHSGRIAAIWLANGIVTIVLLRSPVRIWWLVLASSFLGNVTADLLGGDTFVRAVLLSSANVIETLIVAYPLRYFELDGNIRSASAVTTFLCLALGPATLISGLLAALVLTAPDFSRLGISFYEWYAADAMGLVLVVPIGALIRAEEFQALFSAPNRLDTLKSLAPTIIVLIIIVILPPIALNYFLLPAILYLAFRSGYTGAVVGMTLTGATLLIALGCGVHIGLPDGAPPRERILWLQVFLAVLNVTALFAAAELHKRKRLAQDLRNATRQALATRQEALAAQQVAEIASHAKSQFLGNMSHELRTPLNAILGFSGLLRSDDLPAALRVEYAGDIHNAGTHLLDMINNVLDISKLDAGKRGLDLERIDLRAPVAEAVGMMRELSAAKKITLTTDLPKHSLDVLADRRAILQIALNLLSNAVKFTDEGGKIFVLLEGSQAGVSLTVIDTGIGIPAAFLPRLGTPFEQVHGSDDRRHQGTGLGLALVKALTQLHKGKLSIDSAERVGTTVSVFLPRQAQLCGVA